MRCSTFFLNKMKKKNRIGSNNGSCWSDNNWTSFLFHFDMIPSLHCTALHCAAALLNISPPCYKTDYIHSHTIFLFILVPFYDVSLGMIGSTFPFLIDLPFLFMRKVELTNEREILCIIQFIHFKFRT